MRKQTKVWCTLLSLCLGISSLAVHSQAYSGSAASTYAGNYWKTYNSNYPSYSSDCTNFVSQCLYAGGLRGTGLPASKVKITSYGKTYMCDTTYWSCDSYTTRLAGFTLKSGLIPTSTWTVVDEPAGSKNAGLQDWLINGKGFTATVVAANSKSGIDNLISNAKQGDVIQIMHKGDKRYSHSYLVGKKAYNKSYATYDLYLYAHTGNRGATSTDTLRYLIGLQTIKSTDTVCLISVQ